MLTAAAELPCVPNIIGVYCDEQTNLILMDFCEGQTLQDAIEKRALKPHEVHQVVAEISLELSQLHSKKIIHNDFKADNVIIHKIKDKFQVNIIDFGYSCFTGETPYPWLPRADILQFPHIDPRLAEGGTCSDRTDFYSYASLYS